jgi:excisionase family DNA binding protein
MVEEKLKELPVLLTVKEMAGVLRIGRNSAYEMVYQKKILVLRLGPKKIRIPKYELIQWIKNNVKDFEFNG